MTDCGEEDRDRVERRREYLMVRRAGVSMAVGGQEEKRERLASVKVIKRFKQCHSMNPFEAHARSGLPVRLTGPAPLDVFGGP